MKPEYEEEATKCFEGTNVAITTHGKRHLGAAIGSKDFINEYVSRKVKHWVDEIKMLSKIAMSQPHAAFSAFTHGLAGKWLYISRTISGINHQPAFHSIYRRTFPLLTIEEGLALPARLGGVGLVNPVTNVQDEFESSCKITSPLVTLIINQDPNARFDKDVKSLKASVRKEDTPPFTTMKYEMLLQIFLQKYATTPV